MLIYWASKLFHHMYSMTNCLCIQYNRLPAIKVLILLLFLEKIICLEGSMKLGRRFLGRPEAATGRVLYEKAFLEILQNLQ